MLQRRYRLPRRQLILAIKQLIWARSLVFAARDQVLSALAAFGVGAGGFVDYFIRARAHVAGCDAVATFDRALLREAGFVAP